MKDSTIVPRVSQGPQVPESELGTTSSSGTAINPNWPEWYKQEQRQLERERGDRKRLATMPYRLYLNTAHWRDIKQRVRCEFGGVCALCLHGERVLHVHHRTYKHRGYEDKHIRDLILLCEKCHQEAHEDPTVFARVS